MRIPRVPALAYPSLRLLSASAFFSSAGMIGEVMVLSWIVLELMNSPLWVGVALGVRWAPMFLLGIVAGAVVDRTDKNFLIKLLNVAMALTSAAMGALLLFGYASLILIMTITFVAGSLQALYQTTRQSYTHDLVGSVNVVNGMAVVTFAMRLGGFFGSLVGGIAIERLGSGSAFLLSSSAYLLAIPTIWRVHRLPELKLTDSSFLENLRGYFVEVRRNRGLTFLLVVTALLEMMGFSYVVLLPSLARDVLEVGAEGLGLMNAARSVGGVAGVLLLSIVSQAWSPKRQFIVVLYVFAVSMVSLGMSQSFVLILATLFLLNAMAAMSDILSQGLMQLSVLTELRGRAAGSWVVAIGTQPLGNVQIGGLAALLGITAACTLNGAGLFLLATASMIALARVNLNAAEVPKLGNVPDEKVA